ncbi:MAG: hypothetical protein PVI82_16100 [Desulfobacterales bacterium]
MNQRALEGTRGLIVGEVARFDERKHVFARNRTLKPGSDQYNAFYKENTELEAGDAARRERGGPMGHPGRVDRPHDGPNVAATLACLSLFLWLSSLWGIRQRPINCFIMKSCWFPWCWMPAWEGRVGSGIY